MTSPHPVELLLPMTVLGALGSLLFGALGAGVGVVVGAALGSVASVTDDRDSDGRRSGDR